MERIQISKNLYLDEYIPQEVYNAHINKPWLLIRMLDSRLIEADQKMRDLFGPVTINNWWNGGDRNYSGLRYHGCPFFSQTSDHTYGRASDKLFANRTSQEVREYLKLYWRDFGITNMEIGTSWVHTSVGWVRNQSELIMYKP